MDKNGYNLSNNSLEALLVENISGLILAMNDTGDTVDSDGMSQAEFMRYKRHLWNAQLYVTPIIIFVGLIGNITSFFVFLTTSLRHLSSSVYLAALALADSGFLFQVGLLSNLVTFATTSHRLDQY